MTNSRSQDRFARERADRVQLIEDYLLLGIGAERIAADLSVTPGALARQMHRIGRRDLAKPFQAQWRRRRREQARVRQQRGGGEFDRVWTDRVSA